jgi:hypothetical protein
VTQPHPNKVPSLLRNTLDFPQPVNQLRGVTMYRGRAAKFRFEI